MTQTGKPCAPRQLSLGVSLNDDATFDNFYAPDDSANAQVLALLREQVNGGAEWFVYLWGASGVGLTHLLQAGCHRAQAAGLSVQYLPLAELVGFAPSDLLDGLEQVDYVCIDALQAVAGRPDWDEALFHFYNRMRDAGGRLLVAAVQGPQELPVGLADLRSRLQWGVTCQVQPLTDEQKCAALMRRAHARGLELSEEVAHYIIQRVPRDMNELFCYLQRLDHASLAEQRRLTIPFVKKALNL
ncbi:DnaA regulatory inactivator Hda [Marinimicrobium alkaliphilum]|uniref:DnaA regulatory inactivator Hda n=1 Tax=Marinimicrobium alkaliphilum TaxID=2202654 RepID=UPI000DB96E73|nr:DnaA regulatory inactivator Hda [Marinimicrobium alkaliphilum]